MTPISPSDGPATFDSLGGHRYCLFTTYRRDGTPVATPVWFAPDSGRLLICTDDPSGKVTRIRRDTQVAVAPCTLLGRRLGPDRPGQAELLVSDDARRAEEAMRASYGVGKRLFYALVHPVVARGKATVYMRVTPDAGEER